MVAIVTGQGVGLMDTTQGGITAVGGAWVVIVAAHKRATRTASCDTGIGGGTYISVTTGHRVLWVLTARHAVAAVRGTEVSIVAIRNRGERAAAIYALVAKGARVVIVAENAVICMLAAATRGAAVVGAGVAVVAVDRGARCTRTRCADVVHRTTAAIVTWDRVVSVGAARNGRTDIIRAQVAIVTGKSCCARQACTVTTDIANGAGASVIAGDRVGDIPAAGARVTTVCRTEVQIITGRDRSRLARPTGTDVTEGARVSIRTGNIIDLMGTAYRGITDVVRADVFVIAGWRDGALAGSVGTHIYGSAGVSVVAWDRVVDMKTASLGAATVVGTRVAVVAGQGLVGNTAPLGAGVTDGTGVLVATWGRVEGVLTPGQG